MTMDELAALRTKVEDATDLAGTIAVLRERLAWLDNGKELVVKLKHAGGIELPVGEHGGPAIRRMVIEDLQSQLAEAEASLERLGS